MLKTLAVIDDEVEMETLYNLILEDAIIAGTLDFKFFSDSHSFLAWFKTHTPDLVLCDINMPQISGIELGRIIKDSGRQIPLIFVSGYEARDYQEIMNELGVIQFWPKPLDYRQVVDSINSQLGL
jgi:DNA-binding NtrC family response regulator